MKNLLFTLLFALLAVPFVSFAANDVSLKDGIEITANSITVTVSGNQTVDSITVDSGSFDVVLSEGSSIGVQSTNKNDIDTSSSSSDFTEEFTCTQSASTLKLEKTTTGTATVTVTPKSTTCGLGGGGGGGGTSSSTGGGSSSSSGAIATSSADTAPDDAVLEDTPPEESAKVSPENPAPDNNAFVSGVSAVFTLSFSRGVSHADVQRIQQLLNSDSDTRVAEEGVGSLGNETIYFGQLTEDALKRFQVKYGIVSSGTPFTTGYGRFGPQTRAKFLEVFEGQFGPQAEESVIPEDFSKKEFNLFTRDLSRGMYADDIKQLQEFLNIDPDTRLADEGAGSRGNETTFFGSITEHAVQRFQMKYDIVSSGTPQTTGYGRVGPKTRAILNELLK